MKTLLLRFFDLLNSKRTQPRHGLSEKAMIWITIPLLILALLISIMQIIFGWDTLHKSYAFISALISIVMVTLIGFESKTVNFSVTSGLYMHIYLFSFAFFAFFAINIAIPTFNKWLYLLLVALIYSIVWPYMSLRGNLKVSKVVNATISCITGIGTLFCNTLSLAVTPQNPLLNPIADYLQLVGNACLAPFILSSLCSTMLIGLYEYYIGSD